MSFGSSYVVDIHNAGIYQGEAQVLSQVSFRITKGEFVYLVGRTGSGKSSLLKTLYADLPLAEGRCEVAGYELSEIRRKDIPFLRRKLGIVFQDFQLFYDRNVFENLQFVLRSIGWREKGAIRTRISEVLMRSGLGDVEKKMPHQLSGGEQQRVVIARALLNEPHLLLADEPTGNLDPAVSQGIIDIFHKINNAGTAVLMATHDHRIVDAYPGRVLKCTQGRVLDSETESFALSDEWD